MAGRRLFPSQVPISHINSITKSQIFFIYVQLLHTLRLLFLPLGNSHIYELPY